MDKKMDAFKGTCQEFGKVFSDDLAALEDVDDQVQHHAEALTNCVKLVLSNQELQSVQELWSGLVRMSVGILLQISSPPSEESLKRFAETIKPWLIDDNFRGLCYKEMTDLYQLALTGPWSDPLLQQLLDDVTMKPQQLLDAFDDGIVFIEHRLRAFHLSSMSKQLLCFATAALLHHLTKKNKSMQKICQSYISQSLDEDELIEKMQYFDLEVTVEIIDELMNEKICGRICNAAMLFLWRQKTMDNVEEMTLRWVQWLGKKFPGYELFDYITKHALHGDDAIKSVQQCAALAKSLWTTVPDKSRMTCVEILFHALHLVSSDDENKGQLQKGILSSIAYFLPNSQVSRSCFLTIFIKDPSVKHYFEVAKAYKASYDREKDVALDCKAHLRLHLLEYLQQQWSHEFLLSDNWDWPMLRRVCYGLMSEEDTAYVQQVEHEEAVTELESQSQDEQSLSTSTETLESPGKRKSSYEVAEVKLETTCTTADRSDGEQSDPNRTGVSDMCDCAACKMIILQGDATSSPPSIKSPASHKSISKECDSKKKRKKADSVQALAEEQKSESVSPGSKPLVAEEVSWVCPEESCQRLLRSKNGMSRHLIRTHNWAHADVHVFYTSLEYLPHPQTSRILRTDLEYSKSERLLSSREKVMMKVHHKENNQGDWEGSQLLQDEVSAQVEEDPKASSQDNNSSQQDQATSTSIRHSSHKQNESSLTAVEDNLFSPDASLQTASNKLLDSLNLRGMLNKGHSHHSSPQTVPGVDTKHDQSSSRKDSKQITAVLPLHTPIEESNFMRNDQSFSTNLPPIFANNEELPSTSETSLEKESLIKCPIKSCNRIYLHRHTVQAHIEFRHKISSKKAWKMAESAELVFTTSDDRTPKIRSQEDRVKNMDQNETDFCNSRGWYWLVDDFIFHEMDQQSVRSFNRHKDLQLRSSMARDLITLLGSAPLSFDLSAAEKQINENWVFAKKLAGTASESVGDAQTSWSDVALGGAGIVNKQQGVSSSKEPMTTRTLAGIKSLLRMKVKVKSTNVAPTVEQFARNSQEKTMSTSSINDQNISPLIVENSCQTDLTLDFEFDSNGHYHNLPHVKFLKRKKFKGRQFPIAVTVMSGICLGIPTRTVACQCCVLEQQVPVTTSSLKGNEKNSHDLHRSMKQAITKRKNKSIVKLPIVPPLFSADACTVVPNKPIKRKHDVKTVSNLPVKNQGIDADAAVVVEEIGTSTKHPFQDALNSAANVLVVNEKNKGKKRSRSLTEVVKPQTSEVNLDPLVKIVKAPMIKQLRTRKHKTSNNNTLGPSAKRSKSVDLEGDTDAVVVKKEDEGMKALVARPDYEELLKQAEEMNSNLSKQNVSQTKVTSLLLRNSAQKLTKKLEEKAPDDNSKVKSGIGENLKKGAKTDDDGPSSNKKNKKKTVSGKRRIALRTLSSTSSALSALKPKELQPSTSAQDDSLSIDENTSISSEHDSVCSRKGSLEIASLQEVFCKECNKSFNNAFALTCHIRKRHKGQSKKMFFPEQQVHAANKSTSSTSSSIDNDSKNEREPPDSCEAGSDAAIFRLARKSTSASGDDLQADFKDLDHKITDVGDISGEEDLPLKLENDMISSSMLHHPQSSSTPRLRRPSTSSLHLETNLLPRDLENNEIVYKRIEGKIKCPVADCKGTFSTINNTIRHCKKKHPSFPLPEGKTEKLKKVRRSSKIPNSIIYGAIKAHAKSQNQMYSKNKDNQRLAVNQDDDSPSNITGRAPKRMAYTEANLQIQLSAASPSKRKWTNLQELAYLYNKRVRRKIASALPPAPKCCKGEQQQAPVVKNNFSNKNSRKESDDASTDSFEADYEPQLPCWLCSTIFHRRTNLTTHIQHHLRHIDVVKYRCDFIGCLFAFNTEEELNDHKLYHNGRLVHICLFCPNQSRRFRSGRQLAIHEYIQHKSLKINLNNLRLKRCVTPIRRAVDVKKYITPSVGATGVMSNATAEELNDPFLEIGHRRMMNDEICEKCAAKKSTKKRPSVAKPRYCDHLLVREAMSVLADVVGVVDEYITTQQMSDSLSNQCEEDSTGMEETSLEGRNHVVKNLSRSYEVGLFSDYDDAGDTSTTNDLLNMKEEAQSCDLDNHKLAHAVAHDTSHTSYDSQPCDLMVPDSALASSPIFMTSDKMEEDTTKSDPFSSHELEQIPTLDNILDTNQREDDSIESMYDVSVTVCNVMHKLVCEVEINEQAEFLQGCGVVPTGVMYFKQCDLPPNSPTWLSVYGYKSNAFLAISLAQQYLQSASLQHNAFSATSQGISITEQSDSVTSNAIKHIQATELQGVETTTALSLIAERTGGEEAEGVETTTALSLIAERAGGEKAEGIETTTALSLITERTGGEKAEGVETTTAPSLITERKGGEEAEGELACLSSNASNNEVSSTMHCDATITPLIPSPFHSVDQSRNHSLSLVRSNLKQCEMTHCDVITERDNFASINHVTNEIPTTHSLPPSSTVASTTIPQDQNEPRSFDGFDSNLIDSTDEVGIPHPYNPLYDSQFNEWWTRYSARWSLAIDEGISELVDLSKVPAVLQELYSQHFLVVNPAHNFPPSPKTGFCTYYPVQSDFARLSAFTSFDAHDGQDVSESKIIEATGVSDDVTSKDNIITNDDVTVDNKLDACHSNKVNREKEELANANPAASGDIRDAVSNDKDNLSNVDSSKHQGDGEEEQDSVLYSQDFFSKFFMEDFKHEILQKQPGKKSNRKNLPKLFCHRGRRKNSFDLNVSVKRRRSMAEIVAFCDKLDASVPTSPTQTGKKRKTIKKENSKKKIPKLSTSSQEDSIKPRDSVLSKKDLQIRKNPRKPSMTKRSSKNHKEQKTLFVHKPQMSISSQHQLIPVVKRLVNSNSSKKTTSSIYHRITQINQAASSAKPNILRKKVRKQIKVALIPSSSLGVSLSASRATDNISTSTSAEIMHDVSSQIASETILTGQVSNASLHTVCKISQADKSEWPFTNNAPMRCAIDNNISLNIPNFTNQVQANSSAWNPLKEHNYGRSPHDMDNALLLQAIEEDNTKSSMNNLASTVSNEEENIASYITLPLTPDDDASQQREKVVPSQAPSLSVTSRDRTCKVVNSIKRPTSTVLQNMQIRKQSPDKCTLQRLPPTTQYHCNGCYAKFTNSTEFITHLNVQHIYNRKAFHCTFTSMNCVYSFDTSYELEQHMRHHQGALPFPCLFCKRWCGTLDHLKRHLTTHQSINEKFIQTIVDVKNRLKGKQVSSQSNASVSYSTSQASLMRQPSSSKMQTSNYQNSFETFLHQDNTSMTASLIRNLSSPPSIGARQKKPKLLYQNIKETLKNRKLPNHLKPTTETSKRFSTCSSVVSTSPRLTVNVSSSSDVAYPVNETVNVTSANNNAYSLPTLNISMIPTLDKSSYNHPTTPSHSNNKKLMDLSQIVPRSHTLYSYLCGGEEVTQNDDHKNSSQVCDIIQSQILNTFQRQKKSQVPKSCAIVAPTFRSVPRETTTNRSRIGSGTGYLQDAHHHRRDVTSRGALVERAKLWGRFGSNSTSNQSISYRSRPLTLTQRHNTPGTRVPLTSQLSMMTSLPSFHQSQHSISPASSQHSMTTSTTNASVPTTAQMFPPSLRNFSSFSTAREVEDQVPTSRGTTIPFTLPAMTATTPSLALTSTSQPSQRMLIDKFPSTSFRSISHSPIISRVPLEDVDDLPNIHLESGELEELSLYPAYSPPSKYNSLVEYGSRNISCPPSQVMRKSIQQRGRVYKVQSDLPYSMLKTEKPFREESYSVCDGSLESRERRNVYMEKLGIPTEVLECSYCNNLYDNHIDLQAHFREDHCLHLCSVPHCNYITGTKEQLENHYEKIHRVSSKPNQFVKSPCTVHVDEVMSSRLDVGHTDDESAEKENDEDESSFENENDHNLALAKSIWNAPKLKSIPEEYHLKFSSLDSAENDEEILPKLFHEVKSYVLRRAVHNPGEADQYTICPMPPSSHSLAVYHLKTRKGLYFHILTKHSINEIITWLKRRRNRNQREREHRKQKKMRNDLESTNCVKHLSDFRKHEDHDEEFEDGTRLGDVIVRRGDIIKSEPMQSEDADQQNDSLERGMTSLFKCRFANCHRVMRSRREFVRHMSCHSPSSFISFTDTDGVDYDIYHSSVRLDKCEVIIERSGDCDVTNEQALSRCGNRGKSSRMISRSSEIRDFLSYRSRRRRHSYSVDLKPVNIVTSTATPRVLLKKLAPIVDKFVVQLNCDVTSKY